MFLALLLVWNSSARAFVAEVNGNGQPLRWHLDPPDPDVHTNLVNPVSKAVRLFLAADGYSTTNTAAELNAVRAAFAQWQAIPGTILKFEDAGLVAAGVDVNTSDNQNVIFWAKNSTIVNGGRDNISGLLGATFNDYFVDDNTLIEADIVFNGVQYNWSTDFNSPDTSKQFIESTAAHEIGHFIGLQHSPVGGATMLFRSPGGVNVQAGLSSDEIAAAKWLYGQPSTLASLGRVSGIVTINGAPVFGAVVLAEAAPPGNLIAGTLTRADGFYELPAMPPGQYGVRVTPLDPVGASGYLVRGRDINSEKDGFGNYVFDSVQTGFLPTTNLSVAVGAGASVPQNFAVTSGEPAFRITQIRAPSAIAESFAWAPYPVAVRPGQSNYFVGVASPNLPTTNATLAITGDGLEVGPATFDTFLGSNFISASISVATNATPGLRTLIVQRGNDLAYANGFLEIQPFVRIESITLSASGSTITWHSAPQKRYQLWSRSDVAGDFWQTVGPVVTATSDLTQFTDTSATNSIRFYRLQTLP